MPTSSLPDRDLLEVLAEVVARHGVAGASLRRLSEASGLQRASLYYRFPGGKDEIIARVLEHAAERLRAVLDPAFQPGEPRRRAEEVADGIADYYADGQESCLFVALSTAAREQRSDVEPHLRTWIGAFTALAEDGGLDPTEAHDRAAEQVALLEGSLVIAQLTGDPGPFRRAVEGLASRLVPDD